VGNVEALGGGTAIDAGVGTDDTGSGGNGRPNSGAISKYLHFLNNDPTGVSFVSAVHVMSKKANPLEVTALREIEIH